MRPTLHHLYIVVVALLFGASLFFTFRVVALKRSVSTAASPQALKSGQAATLVTVLDGDEVSVRVVTERIHVRILGLYAFDPTTADPVEQPHGKTATGFLETLRNQPVELVFDELKYDSRKRLLAYLHKDGRDQGEVMIEKGLALAYTKYPFGRLSAYAAAETRAHQERAGLWADRRIVERAVGLKALWDSERRRGE
ncbi:MAG: thermonuclease family protein [Deltaproteobacteria bacterium]|nr:thermonuclease family protein [Deltaproteobacteria bacterium]